MDRRSNMQAAILNQTTTKKSNELSNQDNTIEFAILFKSIEHDGHWYYIDTQSTDILFFLSILNWNQTKGRSLKGFVFMML